MSLAGAGRSPQKNPRKSKPTVCALTALRSDGDSRRTIPQSACGRQLPLHKGALEKTAPHPLYTKEPGKGGFAICFLFALLFFAQGKGGKGSAEKKTTPANRSRGNFLLGRYSVVRSLSVILSPYISGKIRAAVSSVFRAVCRCPRGSDIYGLLNFTVHWSSTSLRFPHKGSGIF